MLNSDLLQERPEEFLKHILAEDENREQLISSLFQHELTTIDEALKVQLHGFQTYYEADAGITLSFPIQQLLSRLFNHQLAARKLLLMGYITEAASVLARALETSWLTRYFDCYPDEIDKWWQKRSEKKQLSPNMLREGLKKAFRENKLRIGNIDNENFIYRDLCEIGHPNFYGSIWHIHVVNESPLQLEVILGGYGGQNLPKSFKEVINHFLRIQRISIGTMAAVYNEYLDRNPVWDTAGLAIIQDLTKCIEHGSDRNQ